MYTLEGLKHLPPLPTLTWLLLPQVGVKTLAARKYWWGREQEDLGEKLTHWG